MALRFVVIACAAALATLACRAAPAGAETQSPTPGRTSFLSSSALLGPVDDPDWFVRNIPFLEVPEAQIQNVYYYRWQTYKEHLVYTGSIYGWLSTEFLTPVSYGAPYGGVVAAAGHQITEGRWLHDQTYIRDDIDYWLNGPGQFPKPMTDAVNADTSDWAHEYSFWAASAVWQTFLATGDRDFTTAELPSLVRQYRGWDNHFNSALGLYWQIPVWDATEYTPASYESSDPYHGGAGYRPTINSYQYGDAWAISSIASLAGDFRTAADYAKFAAGLRRATQAGLWDRNRLFFYHMNRDNNPTDALLDTREEEGFVPWMFDLPLASDAKAMAQLLAPQGFAAPYGPTTAERQNDRWFNYQAQGCCHWDGPSWPYETSQTLTGVANLLQDYPSQQVVTASDYLNLLHGYAATQYKNGAPYVAEAHDADTGEWIYDTPNHSEDYNHSTFNDNVISGLIGLRGRPDDILSVNPLAPARWDYFALENAPYHGHNVTVLWDRTGSRYSQGAGLRVYVDGRLSASRRTLGALAVFVGPPIRQDRVCRIADIAVNSQSVSYGPQPVATYQGYQPGILDNVWHAIDGVVFRTGIPENTRWTTYSSPNATDSFGVNFQRDVTVQGVNLVFYDDGGGVRVPASYDLQYWTGSAWASIPSQTRTNSRAVANAPNEIDFPALTTSQIRVVAPNAGGGAGWGLSEFQAFGRRVFQIANLNSGLLLGVEGMSRSPGEHLVQSEDNGATDRLWELVPAGQGGFLIRNLASGLLMGVSGAQTTDSAPISQQTPDGRANQVWLLADQAANGQFRLRNKHSGLLLGVAGESTNDAAQVVQFEDNGTPDHLWLMRPAAPPSGSALAESSCEQSLIR